MLNNNKQIKMKSFTDLLFSEAMYLFNIKHKGVRRVYKHVFNLAKETNTPQHHSNFVVEYIGDNRFNISIK
tara:strand:+ start:474 stop:686 length:213 start_codon:yes stop_codon:yes gene_type:complete